MALSTTRFDPGHYVHGFLFEGVTWCVVGPFTTEKQAKAFVRHDMPALNYGGWYTAAEAKSLFHVDTIYLISKEMPQSELQLLAMDRLRITYIPTPYEGALMP